MGGLEYLLGGVYIGYLLGSAVSYSIVRKTLNLEASINEEAARDHARKVVNRVKEKGWIHNNIFFMAGKTACEDFLHKTKKNS
ncbi:MAG: hypothetical protein ABIA78_01740 [archaeon]